MLLLDGGASGSADGYSYRLSPGSSLSKPAVSSSGMSYSHAVNSENTTFRVFISGENVFPLELSGITVADNQVLDFVVAPLKSKVSGTVFVESDGNIELEDGTLLSFLENAFSEDTVVTISSAGLLPPDLDLSRLHGVSAVYFIDLNHAEFKEPAGLSIHYDQSKLSGGAEEEDLFAAYWNGRNWINKKGASYSDADVIFVETVDSEFFWSVFYGQIIEDVTVEKASLLIEENNGNTQFVILDVRTPEEFEVRIQNAINIDYKSDSFRNDIDKLDRNSVYLVYCLGGFRSAGAMGIMEEMGFMEVYNMLGGIREWIKKGYSVVE